MANFIVVIVHPDGRIVRYGDVRAKNVADARRQVLSKTPPSLKNIFIIKSEDFYQVS